jgi:hypothetical protein
MKVYCALGLCGGVEAEGAVDAEVKQLMYSKRLHTNS